MNCSRGKSKIPTYQVEEELYNRAPLCKKSLERPTCRDERSHNHHHWFSFLNKINSFLLNNRWDWCPKRGQKLHEVVIEIYETFTYGWLIYLNICSFKFIWFGQSRIAKLSARKNSQTTLTRRNVQVALFKNVEFLSTFMR